MPTKIKSILYVAFITLTLSACSNTEKYLKPTDKSAFVPNNKVEFLNYIQDSQKNIETILNLTRKNNNTYLGGYTNSQAAKMRSPFQLRLKDKSKCNNTDDGSKKGFLLIHGLTDSPYLMKSIGDSLHSKYPCSLIRAVLLPGHGTVVGDSLNMDKKDWAKIVKYGINSYKKEQKITDLYLVAFSTGTALSIDYMTQNPSNNNNRNDKIKGLIFLSTAVKAKSKLAFLLPLLNYFANWESVFYERDAARYESFSYNAGMQFYNLTKSMLNPKNSLKIPVLMAVSADDDTIDSKAAREFFCYSKNVKRRALIWYQSIDEDINSKINLKNSPELMCDNIVEVKLNDLEQKYKTLNLAHTAIPINPNDEHYGFNGKYHNCKKYDSKKEGSDEFLKCQNNNFKFIFAENNIKEKKDRYIRRGTFNPDYKKLEERIVCFVDDNCPIGNILK